ncbi:MAG: YbjN domain-containing protein [Christensenellales bacterium]
MLFHFILQLGLKKIGLKVFTEEYSNSSEAWVGFNVDNGPSYKIHFISNDNDNDVSVRVYGLLRVDENNRIKLLTTLNELNAKYRYVKFVCDEDGDINIEYDFPVMGSSPAESAKEIVARFAKIIDDSYPVLMRAMWS